MVRVNVSHIRAVRRRGRVYWYHRKTGERLPDAEGERIARAIEINSPRARRAEPDFQEGTFDALILAFKQAPEYRELAENSRRLYNLQLDVIRGLWGPLPVAEIRRRNILTLRDNHAHQPATANMLVKVLRVVLSFAVNREMRPDNPAKGVPALKTGPGHRTWAQADINAFLAHAPRDMEIALKLGLYTGQRLGDVLAMTWSDYDGSAIRLRQQKTGERLWIPAVRELQRVLGSWPRTGPLILGLSGPTFRSHWRKATLAAGLDGLTYHGLRYTAAAQLAEAGCDLKEIAAITGHRSLRMLQQYTRGADQKRLASAAILKLERTGRE